jgi:biopolymer transport protein ExbD
MVFLLLIFFMVSTTFKGDAELRIELPEASARAEESQREPIEVGVDQQGFVHVNGSRLADARMETIKQALLAAAGARGESPAILISADAKTPHQAVMSVLDAAQQAGFLRLRFAARLLEKKP